VTLRILYLPRKLVSDHLDADLLSHLEPEIAYEILIDPWFEFAHPSSMSVTAHHQRQIVLTIEWSSDRRLVPQKHHCLGHQKCTEMESVPARLADLPLRCHLVVGEPAFEAADPLAHLGFGIVHNLGKTS
jgi:hypothetical protein